MSDQHSREDPFDQLMAEAVRDAGRFGHREHVKLTWLAVRHLGHARARRVIEDGIRKTAEYGGRPQKFHLTVSRAWVDAVAYHVRDAPGASFDEFAAMHPALLDKRLLSRHYRSSTLAGRDARTGWVDPDLAPFPWS